mmetsp:Transcript_7211/g.16922  ORF Transcript_7211/g.16922 Transcript_7211/m.16922 type:complete len:86 (-) Transcript_7211:1132-1389(-)
MTITALTPLAMVDNKMAVIAVPSMKPNMNAKIGASEGTLANQLVLDSNRTAIPPMKPPVTKDIKATTFPTRSSAMIASHPRFLNN